MIDWRGNSYDIGSTVLYPRMSGRSCEMTEATVTKISAVIVEDTKYESWQDWDVRKKDDPDCKRKTWKEPREEVTVWLLPINSSRFRHGAVHANARAAQYEWAHEQKPVRITVVENITVV